MFFKSILSISALLAVAANAAAVAPRSADEILYMANCQSGDYHYSEVDWYNNWRDSQHGEHPGAVSSALRGDGNHNGWVEWEGATLTVYYNDGNFVESKINGDGNGGSARNKYRGFTCYRDPNFGRELYRDGNTVCNSIYYCV